MIEKISKEIEKIRRKYLDSAEEIVSGYNRENSLSKDYEGRQIYELLQNADDESNDSDGKVLIKFDGKILTVSNTGNPFSFQGVKSLLYPNASPKKIHANKIGCKGLGFRSILTWANSVTVASKDFTLQFSKENASDFLKSIIEENQSLINEIKALTTDTNPIATLSCPKILKKNLLIDGFSTSIIVDCKDEAVDRIEYQIKSLEFEELVFLPNINEIEIKSNNYHKTFYKIVENNEAIIETIDHLTGEKDCANWSLFKKTGTIQDENNEKKNYEFIIAYDPTGKHIGEVLYSYFKTDVKLCFPALIHGTFELTSDRNSLLKESTVNDQLIDILSDFLVQTAVDISESQEQCNYDPLKMIISADMDLVLANTYHLDDLLKEKSKEKRIFPTIAGKYISLEDVPIYTNKEFDEVLDPESFWDLMPIAKEKHVEDFIQKDLGITFYNYEYFCETLNNGIEYYSTEQKVKLIQLVEQAFFGDVSDDFFPHLLEDSNGNIIDSPVKVYPSPIEGAIIDLPKWVKIKFLSPEMEKMLYNTLDINNSKRELSRELTRYQLEEYSFDRLLCGVVNQSDALVDSAEKCKDILNWLWQYYCTDDHQEIPDVKVKVICRDGTIRYATECYFGKEFSNELGERLISTYSDSFISPSCFDIGEADTETALRFFEWIGVSRFPRFEYKELKEEERDNYIEHCNSLLCIYNEKQGYSSFAEIHKVVVGCFEHFDELLKLSDFNDLIAWFLVDERINNRIICDTEEKNLKSCIWGKPVGKINARQVNSIYMKSYLRWISKTTEWIPNKDGIKKCPDYCCFDDDGLSPVIIVPNIDYKFVSSVIGHNCKKDVEALLSRLGVSDVFQEMDKCVIYEALLSLPELDKECKKGKMLYRKIITADRPIEEFIDNNPNYDTFITQGLVLAKSKNIKKYVPVSEAHYANNKVFSNDFLKSINMFEADSRRGEEKIQKLFGVKPLKCTSVDVYEEPVIHPLNEEFKKEYSGFIPFVYACRSGIKSSGNLNRLRSYKVAICSHIKLKYSFDDTSQISTLGKFESVYLSKNKMAYIQVPIDIKSFNELKSSFEFADAVAELITLFLTVYDDKDYYRDLFRDNMAIREKKMRIDRGDDNLETLTKARKIFKMEVDNESEFWVTLADITGIDTSKDINSLQIKQKLGISEELASALNYEDLSAPENIPIIKKIFTKLDIDISLYNSMAAYTIDFRENWKTEYNKMKTHYRNKYLSYLYRELKDEENNADEFYERCETYDASVLDWSNTIDDPSDKFFKSEFGISFSDLDDYADNEVERIIAINLKKCSQDDRTILNNRFSKPVIDSYALFDRIQDLIKPNNCQNEEETVINNNLQISSIISDILSSTAIGFNTINTSAIVRSESESVYSHPKHKKRKHSEIADITKQNIGMVGEASVFKELKQVYPSTRWVSGNAENAHCVPKGDDTCGYDMAYTDENGEYQYVEVKASRDNIISFQLSDSELKFACKNASNYEIVFVRIGSDNKPLGQPLRLGHIFEFADNEDLFNNDRFTIESNNYTITAIEKNS